MDVHENIPLKKYTTMRLGGPARFITQVNSTDELPGIYQNSQNQNIPIFILGGGSNILVPDEGFNGLVLLCRIKGFEVLDEDDYSATVKIGAGENWDSVVERVVEMNLSGIEAMSAIPGTAGAAPVQNVGAYGQEIADTMISLEAFDLKTGEFTTLSGEDCKFGYRSSIFRTTQIGRYFITSITLKLSKNLPTPPFYAGLQKYLDEHNITNYNPKNIRQAVIAIRADKLPDPREIANSGSFFKNAIVEKWKFEDLLAKYPEMPHFTMSDGNYKIPTGWLIEQAGYKGRELGAMRVHDKNALVLINSSADKYQELADARDEIIRAVFDKFGIEIEQEPLEMRI